MTRTAAAAVAVLALSFGCEKSKPAPDEQDNIEPEAARPKPPAEEADGTTIVLLPVDDMLFPVACWDAKTKGIGTTSDCITRFGAGAVRRWECEGDGSEFQGITRDAVKAGAGELAVVPPGADIRRAELARSEDVPKAVRKRLAEVARKDKGKKLVSAMTVAGRTTVDVDGDGKPDNFYTVTFTNENLEPEYEWSGFVVEYGSAPDEYHVLFSHDLETMTLHSAFDIDADGKLELVVSTDYYEGSYTHLARIIDGELDLAVVQGCGA